MKALDGSAKRMIFGTTLLAFALGVWPLLQGVLASHSPRVQWKTSSIFNYRTQLICQQKGGWVRSYDGVNLVQFDLKTGKRQWVWLPKSSGRLLTDGERFVRVEAGSPSQTSQPRFVVRDIATRRVLTRVKARPAYRPGKDNSMVSAGWVTGIAWAGEQSLLVAEASGNQLAGTTQIVDLKRAALVDFNVTEIFTECVSAWWQDPDGAVWVGALKARDMEKGHLRFTKIGPRGQVLECRDLPLDPRDDPQQTNRQPWGYFFPRVVFNASSQQLYASVQYESSLRPGATGSVCAWQWPGRQVAWRWQERDVQPVEIALSPDGKMLAVGATEVFPSTYERGVRLVILDARTGNLRYELRRDRSGSARWQKWANAVRSAPDRFYPNSYDMPTVAGLSWTHNSQSLVAAYADGELISWKIA